jgi:hypothetical protein
LAAGGCGACERSAHVHGAGVHLAQGSREGYRLKGRVTAIALHNSGESMATARCVARGARGAGSRSISTSGHAPRQPLPAVALS